MRKIIYVFLFSCFLVLPIKVKAININSLNIEGSETVISGEQFFITLEATTSSYKSNEGIWFVYTNLNYDRSHLGLTWISSPGFNTVVQYTDNGALFVSEVIENSGISQMCVNGLLYCGTYTLTLRFQPTNITEPINISLTASEFEIDTLDMSEERDYTLDDIIDTIYPNPVWHNLLVKPNVNPAEEKPPVIVPEKPSNDESAKKPPIIPIYTKSSNNYLKSLGIVDYNLNFNKNTTNYDISIDNDVTYLKIEPVVEHTKASYKITGNENLVDGSVIKVTVTAENGKTKEYTINIKKEKPIVEENNNGQTIKNKPKLYFGKTMKKIIMIISGIIGLFVIIGLICVINDIRENKKLDKLLKDEE